MSGAGKSHVTQECAVLDPPLTLNMGRCLCQPFALSTPALLEGQRKNTMCFPMTCWASLTSLFEGIPRPDAGKTWGRNNPPRPRIYKLTPHRCL